MKDLDLTVQSTLGTVIVGRRVGLRAYSLRGLGIVGLMVLA